MYRYRGQLKTALFLIAIFLSASTAIGQSGKLFSSEKKLYVRGNSILIGNNILGNDTKAAFDDVNVPNDVEKMQYIDVDNDNDTFSSSSATIRNKSAGQKVKYAGLYWSGLYPHESAVMRESGNRMIYKGKGTRDSLINNIQLRLPGDKAYREIEGTILFDSYKTAVFANNKPYVCYADVTPFFKSLISVDGEYTIANVRATKGFISGGSAAGWLLYVIYEDETASPKYFSTFDGLVEVSKKAIEVTFDDFKTAKDGTGDADIILATLEGDNKLKTDDCSVLSDAENAYVSLGNEVRAPKNFFNSTITSYDKLFMDRNPASINTLGFDLLKYKLPKGTVSSTTESTSLKFHAKADRFYLFFAAFETEIPDDFLAEKSQILETTLSVETVEINESKEIPTNEKLISEEKITPISEDIEKETISSEKSIVVEGKVSEAIQIEKKESALVVDKKEIEDTVVTGSTKPVFTKEKAITVPTIKNDSLTAISIIKNRPSIKAKGMIQGYYLVTNVFADKQNAKAWKEYLNSEGYNARTFINSETNFISVYIESSTDISIMRSRKEILNQIPYLKNIWVARLNFE